MMSTTTQYLNEIDTLIQRVAPQLKAGNFTRTSKEAQLIRDTCEALNDIRDLAIAESRLPKHDAAKIFKVSVHWVSKVRAKHINFK